MEDFFQTSSVSDEEEIIEMLLRRYQSMDYILNMEFSQFVSFWKKAQEKEADERLWQLWLLKYQHMTKDTLVTFEEFKRSLSGEAVDWTPTDALLRKVEGIKKEMEGG